MAYLYGKISKKSATGPTLNLIYHSISCLNQKVVDYLEIGNMLSAIIPLCC